MSGETVKAAASQTYELLETWGPRVRPAVPALPSGPKECGE